MAFLLNAIQDGFNSIFGGGAVATEGAHDFNWQQLEILTERIARATEYAFSPSNQFPDLRHPKATSIQAIPIINQKFENRSLKKISVVPKLLT